MIEAIVVSAHIPCTPVSICRQLRKIQILLNGLDNDGICQWVASTSWRTHHNPTFWNTSVAPSNVTKEPSRCISNALSRPLGLRWYKVLTAKRIDIHDSPHIVVILLPKTIRVVVFAWCRSLSYDCEEGAVQRSCSKFPLVWMCYLVTSWCCNWFLKRYQTSEAPAGNHKKLIQFFCIDHGLIETINS